MTQPPQPPDEGSPTDTARHADSGALEPAHAVTAIADVTLAPVRELRQKTLLRWALLAHLASTGAALGLALREDLPDWQLYGWMGLASVVLVGNFMRWHRRWGWIRRTIGTLLALVVCAAWALLLADRTRPGWEAAPGRLVAEPTWFWAPVGLLAICGLLLVLHLLTSRPNKV